MYDIFVKIINEEIIQSFAHIKQQKDNKTEDEDEKKRNQNNIYVKI